MHNEASTMRISFPHMGDYHVIFNEILEMMGVEIISPPPITRRTIELGAKYAPDSVCVPFKYNLGNYIEAIERGANTFVVTTGGCRFEYYFEVHKQILADLGHDINFLRINGDDIYKFFQKLNPKLSRLDFISKFWLLMKKLHLLDDLADMKRKNKGFERNEGSFDRFWNEFLHRLPSAKTHSKLNQLARESNAEIKAIPIDKPAKPLRVGIIGELYVLMEPFSNFNLEDKLASMGVEVHRWVSVSSIMHHGVNGAKAASQFLRWAEPYSKYHVGAHGTESIGRLHKMIRDGFDGAVHLKPFGCMPEINALPALDKMCRDYQFPLLKVSLDTHTAETGLLTRLEAFHDMISSIHRGGLLCLNTT